MSIPTVNFNEKNTVIPRKSFLRLKPNLPTLTVAGAEATDVFTLATHGLTNGTFVQLAITSGLTGLTAGEFFVIAADTNTFQLAATAGGVAVTFTADGEGVVTRICDLVGKNSNYKQTIETIQREIPDADGILRPDRIVVVKRMQGFEFETEEIAALAAAFGQDSDISGNQTDGLAQIYIVDPDDEANKVAVSSNQFKASWRMADGLTFNAGQVTVAKIVIDSREKVQLHTDASTA